MAQVKIGFNPQDRFMMAVGNTLVVVTQEGNVFGADVVGRQVQPVFQFSGAKIGFNPQDRFMMALGNMLVVTQDGNVFGADVVGRQVQPVFQFSGAKIGFNPQDRFMMALGNTLVVTQEGNVFGADVVGHQVQPVFQFSGAKIGFNPQDRFMMAVGNTLMVVTQEGNVFGADVVGRQLQPVFQFSGAKIGFNPQDRFMMALGNTLVVVTQEGNAFGADVVRRDIGPIIQVNENVTTPGAARDRLHPGDSLVVGGALTSQDGRFTLVLQGDGNLVLYWSGGTARWATGTDGRAVARAMMQADGNLVLYAPEGTAVWASGTDGHPGAFLTLQNDGNGVIYGPSGPLWATNTATRAANDKEVIQYVFRLDTFHIDTTRAIHEDTDVVSFALKVGDQMVGPLIKHMGDVNNGDHSVGLQFGPIPIPSTAVPILLNYQILNSGHKDQAEIDTLLSQGADYLTKSATASGSPIEIAGAWIAKFFISWLTVDCDGPVAIDQIALTGATLDEWTLGASPHSETRRYNYKSQDGCGSSPDYKVTWSIIRQ